MKYELEIVNFEQTQQDGEMYWAESEIAMLTGLDLDTIRQVTAGATRLYGQWWVETFRKLGFNTNMRWIKFDRKTEHPCMIRCKIPHDKHHWAGFIYYDDHIYHMHYGKLSWATWNEYWPNYRVTSMLQVWIDVDGKLNEITDR